MANERKKPETAYTFTSRDSYTSASVDDLAKHTERVRNDVVPQIKQQIKEKEAGAQRVRTRKLF